MARGEISQLWLSSDSVDVPAASGAGLVHERPYRHVSDINYESAVLHAALDLSRLHLGAVAFPILAGLFPFPLA